VTLDECCYRGPTLNSAGLPEFENNQISPCSRTGDLTETLNQANWRSTAFLVETLAPPEAILSAPALLLPDDANAGEEYVVDRRRLGKVRVVSRFANPTVE
jgi:hypothetical protein